MSITIKRARKSEKQARQKLINQIVSMHEKWASDDDWLQDLFREWTPILAAMDVAELRDMLEATERANGTIKQYGTFGAKFDNRFDQLPIPDAAIKRRGPISAAINCLVDQLDMTHEQVASTNGAEFLRLMAKVVKQRTTAKTLHPIALEILAVLVQSETVMTQDEISRALADRNVRCGRSTVSKHVKSLSELKYVSPPPGGMYKMVITDKGRGFLKTDFAD